MTETIAFWIAAVSYAGATILFTAGIMFTRERWSGGAWVLSVLGFAAHTVSIVARWVTSGRLVFVQDYENALAGTWFICAFFIALALWKPSLRVVGTGVMPFLLLTLGYGLTQSPVPGPVTPAYRSAWLAIHVTFAWFTYAAYTSCAGLAVVELLKSGDRSPRPGSPLWKAPDIDTIQDLTLRLVGFGFLVNGVMIASGAIWAYELWGSYWRWDPVETWSLITWIAYALYLHLRLTRGWTGRRLAWVAIGALFGVMMSFWGVQLLPSSYHLFRDLGGSLGDFERF